MNIDDKTMGIAGGIVLIFGMIVLYLQLTAGVNRQPETVPSVSAAGESNSHPTIAASVPPPVVENNIAPGSPCGSTTGSCLADAEVKSDGCEKVLSKEKLASILANPTAVGSCTTIEAQLQQGCAPGCQLNPSSLVIVPGKIEYSIDPSRDALGRCTIKAKRPVRVSGDCIASYVQQ